MQQQQPTQPHDYAVFNITWAALLAGLLATTRHEGPPARELPLFGLASFSLSKTLSKEKVGAWVREPLVDDERRPRGRGLRYAAGELVTCTRCVGTWSALGLVGLRVLHPQAGKTMSMVLASSAANDWLQAG